MSARGHVLPPVLDAAGVTLREAQVLEAVADRLSNAEIAEQLFISVRTVESHVSSLLAKLDAADRSELATIGRRVVVGPATSDRLPLALLELTEREQFVGRHDELAQLRTRWEEAAGGRARTMILVGEAGIGKSRLIAECAVTADREGATVVMGGCNDDALVPFAPLTEALAALLPSVTAKALRAVPATGLAELARLLPALRAPRSASAGRPEGAAAESARHRLFEAVTSVLSAASRDRPLLVVVEDLQWADTPTLHLLRHVARRVDRSRLLIAMTVRAARLDGRLLDLAEDLRRGPGCDVITLDGLAVEEIVGVLGAYVPRDGDPEQMRTVAEDLRRRTEGNPFFLREVLRELLPGGDAVGRSTIEVIGVPATVRDLIVRSLGQLDDVTRLVVSVAAVVGRRFRIDVVARVTELSEDRIITTLEQAQTAGLIDDASGLPGVMTFTHALVRETLEDELSPPRRIRLHRVVGEILQDEDPVAHLAQIAHHFATAATPADHRRAVTYVVAAAERATDQLAHEQAAELYGRALSLLELAPATDLPRCFDLLLARAAAARRGGMHDLARDCALRAADIGRTLDDGSRMADAALAAGEAAPVWSTDAQLVAALEAALDRVDGDDRSRQARLLARLAQAEYYSASHDRRRRLSLEAVDVARTSGDDATLAAVLSARHVALWGPADTEERLAVADEVVAVSERLGDAELALQGHAWRLVDLVELGDVDGADLAISAHARLSRELGQPLHIRDSALWAAMRALLDGRFDAAEREADRALALSRKAQDPHAEMFHWIQRYWLILERDASPTDMRTLLDVYRELADAQPQVPAWRAKVALLQARLGDREGTAATLAELSAERFSTLPRDAVWVGGLYYLAESVAFLRDRRQARVLYDLLAPFADRIVVIDRALLCLGAVTRVLGLLADVIGDTDTAVSHLAQAVARHDAMHAQALAARTRVDMAEVLRRRGDHTRQVERLLESASATATGLGMTRLSGRIDALAH